MNEKIIKIDGRDIGFKINAALLYLYKEAFGEEYLVDVAKVTKAHTQKEINLCTQIQYRIEWCMAKLYDKSTPPIIEWLEQFKFGAYKVIDIWKELMPLIVDDIKIDRKNE